MDSIMGVIGIYKIQNMKNGKFYIGLAKDIGVRWGKHKSSLRKGNHFNEHLQNAWNSYGEKNFDIFIIKKFKEYDIIKLSKYETKFIKETKSYDRSFGYNKSFGGEGIVGYSQTEETRKKRSEAFSGSNNPMWGTKKSDEEKDKIRNALIGREKSVEERKKLSESLMGHIVSEETRKKISNSRILKGIKPSLETLKKMSISKMGKIHTEETKKQMSDSAKKIWAERKSKRGD